MEGNEMFAATSINDVKNYIPSRSFVNYIESWVQSGKIEKVLL